MYRTTITVNTEDPSPYHLLASGDAGMPPSIRSGRPWTVQTTKRTPVTSEPYRKNSRRLAFDDSPVQKCRQQTLTQAQFVPHAPSSLHHAQTKSIEMDAESKSILSRTSKKPTLSRTKKGLKMQRSTLTQMDFLTLNKHDGEKEHEAFDMTLIDVSGQGDVADDKENVDPNPPKPEASTKKTVTSLTRETVSQSRKRKRDASCGHARYDLGRHGRSLRSRNRWSANARRPSVTEGRRATRKNDGGPLEAEPCRRTLSDGKDIACSKYTPHKAVTPETPKRRCDVIPSSQSPPSASTSTTKRPSLLQEILENSPSKKRSTSATPKESLAGSKSQRSTSAVGNGVSPQMNVCALKYGPSQVKKPDLLEADLKDVVGGGRRTQYPPKQIPAKDDIRGYRKRFEMDESALHSPGEPGLGLSKDQAVQPGFVPSSQTDNEDEEEIPETSQGLREVTSTPSANRSEESLPMSSNPGKKSLSVKTLHRKKWNVSTIADSQEEDYDDDDISFGLSASIVGDNRLISSLSMPLLKSPVAISGLIPPPASDDAPSSVNPFPTSPTKHPPATITRVPTKLPSSSSPLSSPSLSRLPPPPTRTQQSIHPASMTRPSQVSTQAGTQHSLLPTSSMPLPDTAANSSPNHSNGVEHVTIKDSSSVSMPLGAIPSQPPSQVEAPGTVTSGVRRNIHIEDGYQDRDGDLDPKSPPSSQQSVQNDQIEPGEVVARWEAKAYYSLGPEQLQQQSERKTPTQNPPHPSCNRSSSSSHSQLSPPPQNQHPLPARLQLPESLLESIPGPPPSWLPFPPPPLPPPPNLTPSQKKQELHRDRHWDWD